MNRPRWRCSCDRQRVPRRRARVGSLCDFQDTVERVTRRKPEDRTLRQRAGVLQERQAQKKDVCERISAEGEAASGKAAGYGFVKG